MPSVLPTTTTRHSLSAFCGERMRRIAAAAVLAMVGACSSETASYGPLAVLGPDAGGSTALGGTGAVTIGDACVTLAREDGEELLLIWHSDDIEWDGGERSIVFATRGSEPLVIRSGDVISVGGESLIGDVPVERDLEWLAPIDPSCSGRAWIVSGVDRAAGD